MAFNGGTSLLIYPQLFENKLSGALLFDVDWKLSQPTLIQFAIRCSSSTVKSKSFFSFQVKNGDQLCFALNQEGMNYLQNEMKQLGSQQPTIIKFFTPSSIIQTNSEWEIVIFELVEVDVDILKVRAHNYSNQVLTLGQMVVGNSSDFTTPRPVEDLIYHKTWNNRSLCTQEEVYDITFQWKVGTNEKIRHFNIYQQKKWIGRSFSPSFVAKSIITTKNQIFQIQPVSWCYSSQKVENCTSISLQ
jgi:hypothetical protein